MTAKRKLDIDATRERLTALGLIHAAEQLESLLSEAVKAETARTPSWTSCWKPNIWGAKLAACAPRCACPACRRGSRSPTSTSLPAGDRALAHRHARYLRLHPRCRDRAHPGPPGSARATSPSAWA